MPEDEKVFLDLSENQNNDDEAARLAAEQAEAERLAAEGQNNNTNQDDAARLAAEAEAEAARLAAENNNPDDAVVIEDSKLLEVLSERLGRKVESLDELTKKEEKQLNPQIQAINDWVEKTGRPVEDWAKYNKDYSVMSDLDKAREILALKYPTFDAKEIEMELSKYVESEDDLPDDTASKTLELKKLVATDGKLLEDLKLELGEPIKGHGELPQEIKNDVEFAKVARESYDKAVENQTLYDEAIVNSASKMSGVTINLGEGLDITYNPTPEDKKDIPAFLAEMPHWKNADGSFNHDAITSDALKIKNFNQMMKMAYEQGKASGKDDIIKDANNINLDTRQTADTSQPEGAGKGVQIEGLDRMTGKGTKARFGSRNRNQ